MTKKEMEKLDKNLVQAEEQLEREKKHFQVLAEEYDLASKGAINLFDEVSVLFRESSDWSYYQSLIDQHDEQARQFQRNLQESLANNANRQRQLSQQKAEFKKRLKGKEEN